MKINGKYLPIAAVIFALIFGIYILHLHNQGITHLPIIRSALELAGFKRTPKCPKIPVILDGILIDPETFCEQYSTSRITFLTDEDALSKGVVYGFTSDKGMDAYIKSIQKK
jgi:hypothetical protein